MPGTSLFPSNVALILGDPSLKCVGKLNNSWNKEDLETRSKLLETLESIPNLHVLHTHSTLIEDLMKLKGAFVLNLCDEGFNNDALMELHVPALLDVLNIKYSGASSACLAFCYDKGIVNSTVKQLGIPVPIETCYLPSLSLCKPPKLLDSDYFQSLLDSSQLTYPVFIKPVRGDNSLGITSRSLVNNKEEIKQYITELYENNLGDVVIQEFLPGTEYSVGLIGNPKTGYTFLPILQVDYKNLDPKLVPILGFESKWDPSSSYWNDINHIPANLDPKSSQKLYSTCTMLFERFGCRDYARFDFRSDSLGTIKLLEVNPNPGWCWDGKMAKMAQMAGKSYKDLILLILKTAWKREVEIN